MLEERDRQEGNLHRHFIWRVLVPPLATLLVVGAIGLWQLNRLLYNQAIADLKRTAATTAATLDREFTSRETVLKRTGAELFIIKSGYQTNRKKLDQNRGDCRAFVQQRGTFQGAPNGVCEPFRGGFAGNNPDSLAAIEDEYVKLGEELIHDQNQRINERLSAFKQFFPETLALVVLDDQKQLVSSALSGVFTGTAEAFKADAEAALTQPTRGKQAIVADFKVSTFAFPITGGSVLVAFDMLHENFVRYTWLSSPIDRSRAVTILVDAEGKPAYPDLKSVTALQQNNMALRLEPSTEFKLDNVDHIAVGSVAGASNWMAVVASPSAAVLAPIRDAQLAGLAVVGLLLISFLWVGSFFIQRTLRNIISLVSGAMVFGSGRLDYKISLSHADSEFVRLADTMNLMAERIARAEKAIEEKNKEFISVATHEIRAPLTAIIGHLSLVKEMHGSELGDKANHLIDQAYYSTARLRDLVNDMLNAARLESGRTESAIIPTDIKSTIEDVVGTMGVVAKIASVSLIYHDSGAGTVMADENRLRIIVNNFVSNGIKYNRPGGKVTVSHEMRGNQLVTTVADNGLGIPEEQKPHMFEKFFRVDHEDRKSVTGTGLGMYIVKQYIEQMHGKLWFESKHGEGTTFYFSLPLAKQRLGSRLKKLVKRKLTREHKQKTTKS